MPTNVWYPHEQVVGLIAGGQQAILKAVENAEDDRSAGEQDLRNLALNEKMWLLVLPPVVAPLCPCWHRICKSRWLCHCRH